MEKNLKKHTPLTPKALAAIDYYLSDMRAEHKLTLAEMVTGILGSGNVQFHEIARKLRYKGKKPSLADKFHRFVRNKNLGSALVLTDDYIGQTLK